MNALIVSMLPGRELERVRHPNLNIQNEKTNVENATNAGI